MYLFFQSQAFISSTAPSLHFRHRMFLLTSGRKKKTYSFQAITTLILLWTTSLTRWSLVVSSSLTFLWPYYYEIRNFSHSFPKQSLRSEICSWLQQFVHLPLSSRATEILLLVYGTKAFNCHFWILFLYSINTWFFSVVLLLKAAEFNFAELEVFYFIILILTTIEDL